MTRIVLLLVVGALVAASWLVRPRTAPEAAAPRPTDVAPTPSKTWATADELVRWRGLGLSPHEVRELCFAELERAALDPARSPWREFWRSSDPAVAHAEHVESAYAWLRQALERRFGAEAKLMPEFARAFRPLDAELAFLSSEEQIELAARRLEARGRGLGEARAVGEQAGSGARAPVALEFLSPTAALEVRLRDSPLAHRLRQTGVELSEDEFRAAFALLDGPSSDDLGARLAARRSLRALLGAERFLRFEAHADPQYRVVERVGREHGLGEDGVAAAYGVLVETQDALLEAAVGGVAAGDGQAIAARERERLAAVVGPEIATAMLAARAALHLDLARSGSAPGPKR